MALKNRPSRGSELPHQQQPSGAVSPTLRQPKSSRACTRPPTSHRSCSVLLGRREPPSAASVLSDTQDSSQQGEDESADLLRVPSPKNDVSTASPAPSLQPFDVNISSNTGSSAAVTAADLEALSSKLAFSPRRHHRQRKNDGASGRAAQTQQSSQGSGDRPPRVRFADCNEDDDLEFRKHGAEDFVHDEEGPGRGHDEDLGNEAPLTSGTLAGPSLLEVCARRVSKALDRKMYRRAVMYVCADFRTRKYLPSVARCRWKRWLVS